MTIQLEPGFWKTKDGLKAEIFAIREDVAIGWYGGRAMGWELDGWCCLHDCDIISKWIEPEQQKIYKLNEMWRIWYKITHKGTLRESEIQNIIIEGHITNARQWIRCNKIKPIAITRADATEFFEGEGLED